MRFCVLTLVLLVVAESANAMPPVVSPDAGWAIHAPERAQPDSRSKTQFAPFGAAGTQPSVREARAMRVLIEGDELSVASDVARLGGKVLGYHPGAVHAELTGEQLRLFALTGSATRLQLSRRLKPSLDVSRDAARATAVNNGDNLPQPYTGKGVLVGIVDTGIDIAHPTFLNSDGSTRIVALWDQTVEFSDASQRPAAFDYGIECFANHINAAIRGNLIACPTDDGKPIDGIPTEGHGTHVAGVAAGNDETYQGFAPESSLIVVRAHFEEGAILDGVDYVFAKCDEFGRPCVVNLSLGTNAGAHDGTSIIEQLLASKTGAGRLIVAAAGNEANLVENNAFGHAAITLANSGELFKGPLLVPNPEYASGREYSLTLDIWSSLTLSQGFYVAVLSKNGDIFTQHNGFEGDSSYVVPPAAAAPQTKALTGDGKTWAYLHVISAVDPANDRRETLLSIDRCSDQPCAVGGVLDDNVPSFGSRYFIINVKNENDAKLDMWPLNDSGYFYGPIMLTFPWAGVPASPPMSNQYSFPGGDNDSTVTIPSTEENILAVGSYVTKTAWKSVNGTPIAFDVSLGTLSVFSSRGPATDGRVKPDLVAPGEWIASAHSTRDNLLPDAWKPTELFVHLPGTSMAAPHVAGTLALMLERNPNLRPGDVTGSDGLVTRNVQTTAFSVDLPNSEWGYGVLDVAAIFADTAFEAAPDADEKPPAIRNIKVTTSGSAVIVRWATDEPARSVLLVQPESGGRKSASLQSFARSHSLRVGGLSSGTHKVRVRAIDLAGNERTSSAHSVDVGGDCGCASRSGWSPADALPFLVLGVGLVVLRRRLS